jgi:hypothetical protein
MAHAMHMKMMSVQHIHFRALFWYFLAWTNALFPRRQGRSS